MGTWLNPADANSARREPSSPPPPVPAAVFAVAFTELCGRIWLELERLSQQLEPSALPDASCELVLLPAATLRLELLVMLDACDSPRWRAMLATDQRRNLRLMLTDVLEAIAVTPEDLTRHLIERAQDRLLDVGVPRYANRRECAGQSMQ